ncbi:tyrosine-type recombinase/integrase [Methanosalsum zhilinae]|uniref:tyrosine-type recombinase/integrase n=1 Tax=Methanosalsum zhilinae TaxID=39669 RepID=UPI0012F67A4E|nr:site-specific integrase [Methanosalsum zhilinae]
MENALNLLDGLDVSPIEKDNIKKYQKWYVEIKNNKKSSSVDKVHIAKRILEEMKVIGIEKNLHEIDLYEFIDIKEHFLDNVELSNSTFGNYIKFIRTYFEWKYTTDAVNGHTVHGASVPTWVKSLSIPKTVSTVQPHEVITDDELDLILSHFIEKKDYRNTALLAVLADSGVRIGALGNIKIKHLHFDGNRCLLSISKESDNNKTTDPIELPLTWSTYYVKEWLKNHPSYGKEDFQESYLWVSTKNKKLAYAAHRKILTKIAQKVNIEKATNPHAFRHYAIVNWILYGFSDSQIKHLAGWKKSSTRLLEIYGNFLNADMNNAIYQKYGIKTDNVRKERVIVCKECDTIVRSTFSECPKCNFNLNQKSKRNNATHSNAKSKTNHKVEDGNITLPFTDYLNLRLSKSLRSITNDNMFLGPSNIHSLPWSSPSSQPYAMSMSVKSRVVCPI